MNDALIFLDSITDRTCHESFEDLWDVVRQNDLAVFKAYNDRLPPCHRLIDIPKYHPLVKDDTILPLMMKKIFAMEKAISSLIWQKRGHSGSYHRKHLLEHHQWVHGRQ